MINKTNCIHNFTLKLSSTMQCFLTTCKSDTLYGTPGGGEVIIFITFILKYQWCFLQSDWLKIVRLIPKSHHFECDYKSIALSPKIQSNERQVVSRQVVFPKVNFYTKLLSLNLYSNTVNTPK